MYGPRAQCRDPVNKLMGRTRLLITAWDARAVPSNNMYAVRVPSHSTNLAYCYSIKLITLSKSKVFFLAKNLNQKFENIHDDTLI